MDVHRTSDGKVAVVHAGHYRRKVLPANGYVSHIDVVRVEDTPWDSLQKLDAGAWFDKKFQNERIPQLTSVLETFWDVDVRLIVELKAERCPPNLNSTQVSLQFRAYAAVKFL
jgi:glycerophosphoryl diester phosphodiesterase